MGYDHETGPYINYRLGLLSLLLVVDMHVGSPLIKRNIIKPN
jgi:hypothetical protein